MYIDFVFQQSRTKTKWFSSGDKLNQKYVDSIPDNHENVRALKAGIFVSFAADAEFLEHSMRSVSTGWING